MKLKQSATVTGEATSTQRTDTRDNRKGETATVTLTRRGRDYLKATAVTALLVGVAGPPAMAALAFSLSAIAAASLLLSWLGARRAGLTIGVKRVRLFKDESRGIPIVMRSASSNLMSLSSVTFRSASGVAGALRPTGDGSTELVITPRLAGRSDSLVAVFQEVDVLGLFAYKGRLTSAWSWSLCRSH